MTEALIVPMDLIVLAHDVHALTIEDSNSPAFQEAVDAAFQLANNPRFQTEIHAHDTGLRAVLENSLPSSAPFITSRFKQVTREIATDLGVELNAGIIANAATAVRATLVLHQPRT